MNQFTWDLRYEPPRKIPAAIYDEGEPSGPLVLPGNYQVRLTVGAKNFTAPLAVTMDPRVNTSEEDLRKQFDLMLRMRDSEDELNYPTKLNSKLGYLQNAVDSADAQPTEAELGVYAELDLQLESQLAKWREVLAKDVPALNDAMQKNNVPLIAPSAAKAN